MTNNTDQAGIKLTTQTDQYSIAPGDKLEIPLGLTNLGSTPDQLRISVEGVPLVWVSTEQQVVLLQPGEQAQIILSIQPPAPPNSYAGRYRLQLRAISTIDPGRSSEAAVTLTIAGYEVKGRIGILLNSLQYTAMPGEQLAIPVMLINQGLGPDTFQLGQGGLPESWVSSVTPALRLDAGEETTAFLIVQPPRLPDSHAGRHPFAILVASQQAPDTSVSIDCTLTVAAFTEFKSSLVAAQPDQSLPAQVLVQNLSNIPETFRVAWSSPKDSLTFDPKEPQPINVPSGETAKLEHTVQPARRPWFQGERSYPYSVNVQASDQKTQILKGEIMVKGLLPSWVLIAISVMLFLLCLILFGTREQPGILNPLPTAVTPTLTSTATVAVPTATQSQVDQKPLLIERKWYLVAYNDTYSNLGVQEANILFNSNDTLIGYTGCKDLSASYQTYYNQISIANLNLGTGTCPDATLQKQEDAIVGILRSARSYYVANTTMQVAGDAGFLNYSLVPLERPEEIIPPQAVIRMVPQAQAGQVVVFDGSGSTGQVPLVTWKWDFGDGQNASGEIVQHIYRDPGIYKIQLTVADQRNVQGSSAQQITILPLPTQTAVPTLPAQPSPTTAPPDQPTSTPEPLPQPPQAGINGPRTGFPGEPVVFDASTSQSGSSPIVSYSWSFGNGTGQPASPDTKASIMYKTPGDFEVSVTVADVNGFSSIATTRITIDARLDTDVWALSTINDRPLVPGTAITLQFKQGELVGFAGCNTYAGEYTATDNGDGTYTLAIGKLKTSRLSCPREIMDQENAYLTALQQATTAAIQENMITLNSPADELIFYLVEPD